MSKQQTFNYLVKYERVAFSVKQLSVVFGVSEASMRNRLSAMKRHPEYGPRLRWVRGEQRGVDRSEPVVFVYAVKVI